MRVQAARRTYPPAQMKARKELGDLLRACREDLEISLSQAGSMFGVSKGAVALWEANKSIPYAHSYREIAFHYHVHLDSLAKLCLQAQGIFRQTNPLGYELLYLRILKGDKQDEVAKGLRIKSKSDVISRWENGKEAPVVSRFPKIARYYNVPVERLAKLHLWAQKISFSNNPFGYSLHLHRVMKGETLEVASRALRISVGDLRYWETGQGTSCPPDLLSKFEEHYSVSFENSIKAARKIKQRAA